MNHETNWLPGVIVLGAAALAALFFALTARKKHAPVQQDAKVEDLERRYEALLAQLKEHAANRHLMAPDAWEAEKARLELAAVATLKERDGKKHEALKAEARAEKKAQAPGMPGWVWGLIGAAIAVFFVQLGNTLTRESKDRVDGQEMTGIDPAAGQRAPMMPNPDEQKLNALIARVERSPDDLEVLSEASTELVRRQRFEDAAPLIRRASAIDPFHVQTRINRAVLDALQGEPNEALAELEHVASTYDEAWEARLYAGALALQNNDPTRALTQFETYLLEAPPSEQPPMLRRAVEDLRKQVQAGMPMLPAKQP